MEMSSSLSKILETGINVFKSNSEIMKMKNIMNFLSMRRKMIDDYFLLYLNDLFGIKLIFLRYDGICRF